MIRLAKQCLANLRIFRQLVVAEKLLSFSNAYDTVQTLSERLN